MSRFYFHIHRGGRLIPDDEGMELSDMRAAYAELVASVEDLVMAEIRATGRVESDIVEIVDAVGRLIDAMPVRPVVH